MMVRAEEEMMETEAWDGRSRTFRFGRGGDCAAAVLIDSRKQVVTASWWAGATFERHQQKPIG
jgi:hypothetical protein